MYTPPLTEIDNDTLTLTIIQTIRSKDTERITTTYSIRDSILRKSRAVWGVFSDSSQQNLPFTPKHFEDLSAYLQLSWDNLQGEVYHPIIKGTVRRVHIQMEGDIRWQGKQATLQLSGMKETVRKDRHYLSATLLADYLDKYFTHPNSFRALKWIKQL